MKKKVMALAPLFFLLSTAVFSQSIDTLTFLTEDFPPYNYLENGTLKGSSVRVVERIFQISGSKKTLNSIQVLPWSRAYKNTLEQPNTALFTVTRMASRENDFKWVGPLTEARNVLMARKDRKLMIRRAEDLLQYSIGAVRFDAGATLSLGLGYPEKKLVQVTSAVNAIKMLENGHIDLFAYDENVTNWLFQVNGMNPKDYETVYILAEGLHFIALNKNTPNQTVKDLQDIINDLRKSGELGRLIKLGLAGK